MQKSKVLVTGATGVLGKYLVARLVEKGYHDITILTRSGGLSKYLKPYGEYISVIQGDVRELYPLVDLVEEADYIIHGAAVVSFDKRDRKEMFSINVDGTSNIVDLALSHDVKKFIQISSIAAIGRPEKGDVLSEETKWSESKYNSDYGKSKFRSEQEVWRGYAEGLNMAIVNPSVILGQGDYKRSSLKLIPLLGKGMRYYPTGNISVVDARDVADLAVILMESEISGERYIASGHSISYKSFFEEVCTYLGRRKPSVPISKLMAGIAWRGAWLKSRLSGSKQLITRETLNNSTHRSSYNTAKSTSIPGFSYRSLDETIAYACDGWMTEK